MTFPVDAYASPAPLKMKSEENYARSCENHQIGRNRQLQELEPLFNWREAGAYLTIDKVGATRNPEQSSATTIPRSTRSEPLLFMLLMKVWILFSKNGMICNSCYYAAPTPRFIRGGI